jgi:hypothetical protein
MQAPLTLAEPSGRHGQCKVQEKLSKNMDDKLDKEKGRYDSFHFDLQHFTLITFRSASIKSFNILS